MIPIVSKYKLEKVFLDICGPFPISGGRHRYKFIIIIFDHYLKFNRATTQKTTDVILKQFIPSSGIPTSIVTDHGTQFKDKR